MDGWVKMNVWVGGWMDGCMSRKIYGWVGTWMDGWACGWMDREVDECVSGWMDGD